MPDGQKISALLPADKIWIENGVVIDDGASLLE